MSISVIADESPPGRAGAMVRDVDFAFQHTLPASPAVVADVLLDPDYQASLHQIGPLESRQLLSQQKAHDGTVVRRIRCVFGRDIGSAARRFVGDPKPSWVEEAVWNPQSMRWDWRVIPDVARKVLSANGSIELRDAPQGTVRRVSGTVRVKVPFYGGKVEGLIADGIKRAYDEEAAHLVKWIETAAHNSP